MTLWNVFGFQKVFAAYLHERINHKIYEYAEPGEQNHQLRVV